MLLSFALLMLRRDKMKLVDLRPIKDKAVDWPDPVKTLVLSEPDLVPFDDFFVKITTWEKLIRLQRGAKE